MISGSKKEILNLLKRNGILSVDEISDSTGLAKTTLREHFLQLERDGLIERMYERSGPGRPSLVYQLTARGHATFPSGESLLFKNFLSYLKDKGDESKIEAFFNDYWNQRFERAQKLMDNDPESEPVTKAEKLVYMLEKEGFMPDFHFNKHSKTIEFKECNCPFRDIVGETRLPCRLEAEFFERIFDSQVERVSYIADGDHSCKYVIQLD